MTLSALQIMVVEDHGFQLLADEILATGLAPTQSAESAMLFVQVAGTYTVVVRGVDNSSGIGLVEAYHLADTQNAK